MKASQLAALLLEYPDAAVHVFSVYGDDVYDAVSRVEISADKSVVTLDVSDTDKEPA